MSNLGDDPEVIRLAQEMADHTRPRCGGKTCYPSGVSQKNNCCEKIYCDIAEEYATMHSVEVPKPGPVDLPYMGAEGCVMPPHLRLVCTVHDCQINSLGLDPTDPEWTEKYFDLRNDLSFRLHQVEEGSKQE